MATTVYTIQDAVKLALNDAGAGVGQAGTWLSDAYIDGFVTDRAITYGSFTIQRWGSGAAWFGGQNFGGYGNNKALYFDNQTTPFAAEGSETYDIYARGMKVKLKTGSRTASTITINGTLIDFDRVMADLFWLLYTQTSGEDDSTTGNSSQSPIGKKQTYLNAHEFWKGVVTSGY